MKYCFIFFEILIESYRQRLMKWTVIWRWPDIIFKWSARLNDQENRGSGKWQVRAKKRPRPISSERLFIDLPEDRVQYLLLHNLCFHQEHCDQISKDRDLFTRMLLENKHWLTVIFCLLLITYFTHLFNVIKLKCWIFNPNINKF